VVSDDESRRLEGLGRLAGGVSHDLNNLLGVILNFNALVLRRLSDPRDVADLGEVEMAAEQAVDLTRQLTAVAGQVAFNPEPLAINGLVRRIASAIEPLLGTEVELQLEIDGDCDGTTCEVDEAHVTWILTALATNGRDAMPAGGRLTLRVRAQAPDVVVEVIDSGCGMTAEVMSRAFEPFYTTKPRTSGTGLGLAVAYGLVQQSGGRITLNSTPGLGTTVTVVLPGHHRATDGWTLSQA
jgi:two-component system cell cycle sensor histidine kinase/response regulator CckA